jgi:hypothetical protein
MWKYHSEVSCIATLYKWKCLFFKNVEQEDKTDAVWVFALWEGRCMERM